MRAGLATLCLLALAPGCGADAPGSEVSVGLVLGNLTTVQDAARFELYPGTYDFVASGFSDVNGAVIDLQVFESGGPEVASGQVLLTLAQANATAGLTGSGLLAGIDVGGTPLVLVLDFRWDGRTPSDSATAQVRFFRDPDINDWSTNPQSPVPPQTSLSVSVSATNHEGPNAELAVVAQFVDPGGTVVDTVTLTLDPRTGRFIGPMRAPDQPAVYTLRIVVTDNTGGVTQHDRPFEVR